MDHVTSSSTTSSGTIVEIGASAGGFGSKLQRFYEDGFSSSTQVQFWHPELRATRKLVAAEWLRTTLILCAFITGVLSLFWGAFMGVNSNLSQLNVWIVNFDNNANSFIGPLVAELALNNTASYGAHVSFEAVPASRFHDAQDVGRAVYHEHAWAAVIVHANASDSLRHAAMVGDRSYSPSTACELIYITARDQVATQTYIVPALRAFQRDAVSAVGMSWPKMLLSDPAVNLTALSLAPQTISPAIGFTDIDLRKFGPPQVLPSVTVGLIYLIIVAFFSYAFFMPTHTHFINEMEGHRKIKFHQLIIWKYMSTLTAYFFMSLCYSLVSLAFQISFAAPPTSETEAAFPATAYGRGSFPVLWCINFIGMCALGFACENMAMLLGQPWTALWLIFWVISNVATSFYPLVLAPGIYQYGYAFPLHAVVEATRIVLFDLKPSIGLHLGILCVWWAVNTTLFPFCAWWLRHMVCKPKLKKPKKSEHP